MTDEEEGSGIAAPTGASSRQDRIAAFEMIDKMGNATVAAKTLRLSLVGFNRQEIAAMLQISVGSVSQNIYAERNKGKKKPAAKKGSTTE
jgi:DNA-directed RNA polymerase specialized sigma24 family protein